MLTIKAACHEVIERLIYYKTAKPRETKEIVLTNEHTAQAITKVLNKCLAFTIEEDEIYCKVNRTESEIQADLSEYKKQIKYNLNRLRVWGERNEEGRIQIETYLKAKGLDWIIEGIKNP